MKTSLLISLFCLMSYASNAQLISIEAEQIPIPMNAYQDLNTLLGGEGPIVCYRVYAAFPEDLQLAAIIGSSMNDTQFSISSGNTFYQNPYGSALGFEISPIPWDDLYIYDSWFTIGAANTTENNQYNLSFSLETIPFFDNFELGYDVEIDTTALNNTEASLVVLPYFENGVSTATLNQPDVNGRVLIGQFTTRQFVSGCMTFLLLDVTTDQTQSVSVIEQHCFSFSPTFSSADFNQDGVVDINDLAIIISNFGCVGGCNADLTGDDLVSVEDLMSFIYFMSLEEVN